MFVEYIVLNGSVMATSRDVQMCKKGNTVIFINKATIKKLSIQIQILYILY